MDPISDLVARFTWKRMWLSGLRILRSPGPVEGDCKSFALTVAWLVANRSVLKMIWNMVTLQTVIWIVWANEGHAATWVRGRGWICNIYPSWRKDQPSKRLVPLHPSIFVVIFTLGWWL